jgi:hypothetical protein
MEMLEQEFTTNCLVFMSLGQHGTHFDSEIEAMNTEYSQNLKKKKNTHTHTQQQQQQQPLRGFSPQANYGYFKKYSVLLCVVEFDALPSERVTEIH